MVSQSICRKSVFSLLLTFVLGTVFSQVAVAQDTFTKVVGSAYSVKTGALLYRETHTLSAGGKHNVEYSEPNGAVFGHKVIDESRSRITPSFTQINERNGEKISVKSNTRQVAIQYQKNRSEKTKTKEIDYEAGMVVDAGFNAFVLRYWGALENDTKMHIQFVVPSRQTAVGFTVGRSLCKADTQRNAECFSLTADSWIVRMVVSPILLAYDPDNKRLLRFTGRANIGDKNGDFPDVDIQFHYF
ncbi:MAG: hypothetical protein ACTIM4_12965 [Marinomonas sp.]